MTGPDPTPRDAESEWLSLPPLRYPYAYLLFIALSTLDILLTWYILRQGGSEVNPVAERVILYWGLPGAIGFKYALTLFVVVACEIIGRVQERWARNLIRAGILVASFPPAYSLALITLHLSLD
jgi:hypothetical protein